MAEPLVPDGLWEESRPLLPRHKAKAGKRGRPPVSGRACLSGIVFVPRSGIPWEMLPLGMGPWPKRHLLAALAPVAARRRLQGALARPAEPPGQGGPHRPAGRLRGRPERPRRFWGS
jgi:transposase